MRRAQVAVQTSLDEVYQAFKAGHFQSNSSLFAVADTMPIFVNEEESLSAMFKWDGDMLWRRSNISDLRDTDYIKQGTILHPEGWWSATTLAELELFYGPPSNLPPRPGAIYGSNQL